MHYIIAPPIPQFCLLPIDDFASLAPSRVNILISSSYPLFPLTGPLCRDAESISSNKRNLILQYATPSVISLYPKSSHIRKCHGSLQRLGETYISGLPNGEASYID